MSPASIAIVVLLAILVGAAVPVLIQLRRTLKTLDVFLQQTGERLDETLEEVRAAAGKVKKVVTEFEEGASNLRLLFDAAGDLGRTVAKLRDAVSSASLIAGAVAPAVVAGVKSFFKRDEEPARSSATEAPEPIHEGQPQEKRS